MKLVKQSFEILEQEIPVRKLDDSNESYKNRYLEYMYKHIEKCGRTCYKSEDRITEDSAVRFVNGLIKSKHYSVLEHGVIYLTVPQGGMFRDGNFTYVTTYNTPDSRGLYYKRNLVNNVNYITTNYRYIVENKLEEWLKYLSTPTEYHEKRHTVLLHSCIHVYKDLTRHRKMSFSIESTRYVNYSKTDKFGEMKFVLPPWCKYISPGEVYWHDGICYRTGATEENNFMGDRSWTKPCDGEDEKEWKAELKFIRKLDEDSKTYRELIELGWQAQQAAEILPQGTAADVVMSAFSSDWDFIFKLRTDIAETGQPHPLVKEIMNPLYEEFKNRKYLFDK